MVKNPEKNGLKLVARTPYGENHFYTHTASIKDFDELEKTMFDQLTVIFGKIKLNEKKPHNKGLFLF